MIFQDPFTALNPVLTIETQMAELFAAHPDKKPSGDVRSVLARALEEVQLEPGRVLGSYPHQLSGGQKQRVMIAIAILTKPQFLLADEPTTALDVIVQKEILELLAGLQRSLKMGMLLVSHNLGVVAQYAQRMVVMHNGEVVEEAPSRQIFAAPKHPYTRELLAALPRMTTR